MYIFFICNVSNFIQVPCYFLCIIIIFLLFIYFIFLNVLFVIFLISYSLSVFLAVKMYNLHVTSNPKQPMCEDS